MGIGNIPSYVQRAGAPPRAEPSQEAHAMRTLSILLTAVSLLAVSTATADDTPTLATQFPNFNQFPNVTTAFHVVPRRGRNAGLTLLHRF